MKRTLALLFCVLGLAIAAAAHNDIDFSDLPLVETPAPVPAGYSSLNWGNFWYVDPGNQRTITFIGGTFCGPVKPGCYGVIGSMGGRTAFQPVSADVAAGSSTHAVSQITVLAYNHGSFVGSASYKLTTTPQTITFPESWGGITEMQIQTDQPGGLLLFHFRFHHIMP